VPARSPAIDWAAVTWFAPRRRVAAIPINQIRLSCGYRSDRRSPLNYESGLPTVDSFTIEPR
jgi:hypothetical protein